MRPTCTNCGNIHGELFKTVYGDFLCEDCWDSYICTEAGMLEYLIGICTGDYPMSEFDADFLGEVVVSWNRNVDRLALSKTDIDNIEEQAACLGLL